MRLTTELTSGTGPKIEPSKISRADSDVFNHYFNWLVWLKIMTLQAEYLPALQPFSSKNAFCAETLSYPAIAVENNDLMTSHPDSSFSFKPAVGSSATHQKSVTAGIIASSGVRRIFQWRGVSDVKL